MFFQKVISMKEKQKTKKQSKTDNSTNSEEDKNKDAVDVDYKVVNEDNNPNSSTS